MLMMTTGAGARKPGIRVPPEFLCIERGVHTLELDNAPAEAIFERIAIGEFLFKFGLKSSILKF